MKSTTHSWLKDLIFLTLSIGLLFVSFMGSRPLMVPDEGRYAEIPREMVASGDYVTPRLNDIKYFEKPPMTYWLESATIQLFGMSEWSLRAPLALLGLIGCLIVYVAGRKLFDRRSGILASFVLATNFLYFTLVHFIIPDLPMTIFLTVSLLCFILGEREPPGRKRIFYFWMLYIFAALATLTKGLIGIVFPGMIIFVWVLITNEWRSLKQYFLPSGMLIFLVIAAPWHMLMQLRNPEFFQFYFVEQHFLRYLTEYAHRSQHKWFLSACIILGFFPWIGFLVQSFKFHWPKWAARQQHKVTIFLMTWAIMIFLFFQLSQSLLLSYALPIIPPLALLTGHYLSSQWEQKHSLGINIGFAITLCIGFCASLVGIYLIKTQTFPAAIGTDRLFLCATVGILLITVIATALAYWRKGLKTGFIVLALGIGFVLISSNLTYPVVDPRSVRSLALTLKPLLRPNDEVAAYHFYYQDLPVYLQRRVTIVEYKGEMDFGTEHQDAHQWMINLRTFWKRWESTQRMFVIMNQDDYKYLSTRTGKSFYVVAQTPRDILLANQKP